MGNAAYDRYNPMVTRHCVQCDRTFVVRKRGSQQFCKTCREKNHKKTKVDEGMRPGEAMRYLEAMCSQETAPRWEREAHLFPSEGERCIKCGCIWAAAENTRCAQKVGR